MEARGDSKGEQVQALVEQLSQMNITAPAQSGKLLQGRWKMLNNSAFGGTAVDPSDGKTVATLGRAAFNMFEPTGLVIRVESVLQDVEPLAGQRLEEAKARAPEEFEEGSEDACLYDTLINFSTVEEQPLYGTLRNFGQCKPTTDTRLEVAFTGIANFGNSIGCQECFIMCMNVLRFRAE